jgi:RNA polymerase sigma-70 factor (ECF subfamily)
MAAMTEEAVAEAHRVETFEDFFHANYERLLRAMYLATGNRQEAEDLAQDAMARVLEKWDRVREIDDPVGYLFRVALNRRRNTLRRLAVAIRKAPRAESPTPSEPTAAVDDRDAQRETLVLCDWLGMSDTEAGEVLRTSAGAVRTRLSRARAAMRELLGGPYD